MKPRVGKRAVKQSFDLVVSVGSGNLQNFLRGKQAFAYSSRAEGWACDYYDIGYGVCLSDGYAAIGKRVPHDVLKKYDEKASEILNGDYWMEKKSTKNRMEKLMFKFRDEILMLRDEKRLLKEI